MSGDHSDQVCNNKDHKARIVYATYPDFVDGLNLSQDLLEMVQTTSSLLKSDALQVTRFNRHENLTDPYDLAIADFRQSDLAVEEIAGFAASFKEMTSAIPLLFLLDATMPYAARAACKQYGATVNCTNSAADAVTRIISHIDNFNLVEECSDRLKTLRDFKAVLSEISFLPQQNDRMKILMTGVPSPNVLAGIQSLKNAGHDVMAAMSSQQTLRYLEQQQFDCLLLVPGRHPATFISLVKLLRRNDHCRDLPILSISGKRDEDTDIIRQRFISSGADVALTSHDADKVLAGEVTSMSRRARLRRNLRQFLLKASGPTSDAETRISELDFFEYHMQKLVVSSQQSGRALSLSAIQLETETGQALTPGILSQAIGYAEMMLKEVEMMTQISDRIFLVSHPGITQKEAEQNIRNILTILAKLQFRDRNSGNICTPKMAMSTIACSAFGEDYVCIKKLVIDRLKTVKLKRNPTLRKKKKSAPELYLV